MPALESDKMILKLKHDLIKRTDERNYYKNKNEELNQQIKELKRRVEILETYNNLLLLKIKEGGQSNLTLTPAAKLDTSN